MEGKAAKADAFRKRVARVSPYVLDQTEEPPRSPSRPLSARRTRSEAKRAIETLKVQVGGHDGSFLNDGSFVLKKADDCEVACYESMVRDEIMENYIPAYEGVVEVDGQRYIKIEDLTHGMTSPAVMDCKIGIRTYLEEEANNPKKRMDLLEKMVKVDPNEPSETEKNEGITKVRYMQFREKESTSSKFGFRIEGVMLPGKPISKDFKDVNCADRVQEIFSGFTESAPGLASVFTERLRDLGFSLPLSPFFQQHEIVGASILFAYDGDDPEHWGVNIIDFAKTRPTEKALTHYEPWVMGNQEDGFLIGLENITCLWDRVADSEAPQDLDLSYLC